MRRPSSHGLDAAEDATQKCVHRKVIEKLRMLRLLVTDDRLSSILKEHVCMSTITTTYDKDNKPRWRVRVNVAGGTASATFRTSRADAEAWGAQKEEEFRAGLELLGEYNPPLSDILVLFLEVHPNWDAATIATLDAVRHLPIRSITPELIVATWPNMGAPTLFLEAVIEFARGQAGVALAMNPVAQARRRYDELPYRPISVNEREWLIHCAEESKHFKWMAPVFALVMDCALKQVDVLKVQRKNIFLQSQVLRLPDRPDVPLRPQTVALLRKHLSKLEGEFVFLGASGTQLNDFLKRSCRNLKIEEITFTDMRMDSMYRACLKHGYDVAWKMFGRKSSNNTAWLSSSVARNQRLLDALPNAANFTL